MEKIKKEKMWYDNADFLTNLIIGLIIVTIILSQSFAVNNNIGAINTFRSLFNHNSSYILALIYFVLIKSKYFQKYFNITNLLYIFFYFLNVFAAFLTLFQSFSVASLCSLFLNIILLIYMIYTFLYDTRIWKDFKLGNLPFDEIKNEWYYYAINFFAIVALFANLIGANISNSNFDGVVLSVFDAIYKCLFARYVFLYKRYELEKNKGKEDLKNER